MATEHVGVDAGQPSGPESELLSADLPRSRDQRAGQSQPVPGHGATASDLLIRSLPTSPRVSSGAGVRSSHVDHFLQTLRTGRPEEAMAEIEAHIDVGVPLQRIYLDLLAPVACRLGELWDEDVCDYFEVTLQVGRIQRFVRLLASRFHRAGDVLPPSGPPSRVYLAAPAGEQHTLGLVLVAEFFVQAGWHVTMGNPLDMRRTVQDVQSGRFDLMGVSLSREETVDEVRGVLEAVRTATVARPLPVVVGGSLAGDRLAMARGIGADAWAENGLHGLRVARNLSGCLMAGRGN